MRQHEFDEVGKDERREEVRLENKRRLEVEEGTRAQMRDEDKSKQSRR